MAKFALDLRGLPAPIANALTVLVEAIRAHMPPPPESKERVDLPVWEGQVIKPWSRADLYEEHLDRKFPPREDIPDLPDDDSSSTS